MKIYAIIFSTFLTVTDVTTAYAEENSSVSCSNAGYSITVDLVFTEDAAEKITWKKSRNTPPEFYQIVSEKNGTALWPDMPTDEFSKWPIGTYVAKKSSETVVLSVARDASFGGGGYLWEGMMTLLDSDGKVFTWGMFCTNF